MQVKVKVELRPEVLKRLVRAEVYRQRYLNIWRTRDSLRHFIRSRRAELERRGLLYELTTGLHVDAPALDEALPQLLMCEVPA